VKNLLFYYFKLTTNSRRNLCALLAIETDFKFSFNRKFVTTPDIFLELLRFDCLYCLVLVDSRNVFDFGLILAEVCVTLTYRNLTLTLKSAHG